MTCLPRDRVGVQVVVVGHGVGVRVALERHGGAPPGHRLRPPKAASSDLRWVRAAPGRAYGGHCPGRTSLHHKSPHPPRPAEALGV